ncbi:MAG TPA: DsbA family oxidoreductase [Geminicoccus sp.]|uniref:DsbA family oxidoreductase n=1 Tax=Geminicoccus sp. TaxID=2024832 RepID=UPI002C179F6D|nr:DsbA family oxidoreductase [Geminicoccus sp.]HWL71051.1 DsbA family oxidoreductase [Geminicoccus sp.]
MSVTVRIDFVSDIVCPWCAVGLYALEEALRRLEGEVEAELHFQPFELNPHMPQAGQEIVEHLTEKYGITPEQVAANAEVLRQRGAAVGFEFRAGARQRTYNSFDAHRLLHWAELKHRAAALKHALLRAYFTHGENIADHDVLARLAIEAGLDGATAREILGSDRYAEEVRAQERRFTSLGISAVPSVILNNRHLLQGGQPPEMFERALRQVAGHAAA